MFNSIEFTGAGEEKILEIDGKKYTVTSDSDEPSSLLYGLNSVTGEIVFGGSGFTIRAENDKAHNLAIYGDLMHVYTGDKDDTIKLYASKSGVYANGGDDSVFMEAAQYSTVYGGAGNDILINEGGANTLYGGDGNDTLEGNLSTRLFGENGDDVLILKGGQVSANGGAGNAEHAYVGALCKGKGVVVVL